MLVQAQVVPWWGTGRRAEFSPSQPVTGITHRQEDRRVRLQNRVVSTTARRATRTLPRNETFCFAPYRYGWRMAGRRPKPNAINQLTGNPGNRPLIGRYRITAQSCLVFAPFPPLLANCAQFCVGWRRELWVSASI